MAFGAPRQKGKTTCTLSSENTSLIESLLNSRGDMSIRQKKALKEQLTGATPTTAVAKGKHIHVAAPKVGRGSGDAPRPMGIARFSGIKLKSDIVRENPEVYSREQFRGGGPIVDREALKEKLAKTMEYNGRSEEERKEDLDRYLAKQERLQTTKPPLQAPVTDKDAMVDEILHAIDERRFFLAEMESLGQGDKYTKQIKAEISAKLLILKRLGVDTTAGR